MIRMVQSSSASHAKAYFTDALLKSDYYVDDQELQGNFYGKLSKQLGITGAATKDNFFLLSDNINPATGKPLTPRTIDTRRTGYDINFHVPKSVSILHALSNDDHILKAFKESVGEVMHDIETDSRTKVRKNGSHHDRDTGNLAWAEFIHQTARPVDGSTPDPHLHAHCFVVNATYDDVEKQVKAGEFGKIKTDMPFYQAKFQKNFSDKLIKLGYQIRRTEQSFEVEGVPQSVIDLFSKRTNEIGEFAKEHGITDKKTLAGIGARIRAKKQKGLSMTELKADWRRQIKEGTKVNDAEMEAPIRHAPQKQKTALKAQDCIDHAISHVFERASVIADRRLLATAYRYSIGNAEISLDGITDSLGKDGRILHVQDRNRNYCTTKEVLAEEKRMVALARQGIGKFQPLYENTPKLELDGQQAAAVAHVLTTKNQVSIITGKAGTGKTTLMKEAVRLMEAKGKKVTVVAPTAQASRNVLAQEGFKDAQTVATLLKSQPMQENLKGQILWVDEAGLLGTQDMAALLVVAKKQDARVILGGDTRQHASVIRGDALRILNTVGGIKSAQVSQIFRQRHAPYREAVADLSTGDIKTGFDKLDGMGAIKTVDPMQPNDELIEDYLKAVKKGKSVLVVSPTRKQGHAVTDALRKRLRLAGKIGKKEVAAKKLENLNLTEAEKTDWRNFRPGQVVQFSQNVPAIQRGSAWTVKDAMPHKITLTNEKNEKQYLPVDRPTSYDVFAQSEIGLAKSDKLRITRNGFDEYGKRLDNGTALEVVSAKKSGKLTLISRSSKTVFVLDKSFGHIDHDYCTTSHSAQGKTVDEVFISQPAATFGATDAKQFYVSVSRGREAVTIYTDDRDALLSQASELGDRTSAMELVGNISHTDYVVQKERADYGKVRQPQADKGTIYKKEKEMDYEPGA